MIFWCTAVAVIWALAFHAAQQPPFFSHGHASPGSAVEAMATWDGAAYQEIAQSGYSTAGDSRRFFIFFPLYPALARIFGGANHVLLAGVIISQLLTLASILLMSGLVHGSKPASLLREPGFWMLISPFGFFFFSFYTEALFLFLTLVHYAAFRADRPGLSFAAGFLAGLTRPTAIALPALLGFEALLRARRGEPWKKALICAAAPAVAFALYAIVFVGWKMGNPRAYLALSDQYWAQVFTIPFSGYLKSLLYIFERAAHGVFAEFNVILMAFSTTAVLAVLFAGRKRLDPALTAYACAALILLHAVTPAKGTGRYEVVLFPVFFALATGAIPRIRATWAVIPAFAYLSMRMFMHFAAWDWIA